MRTLTLDKETGAILERLEQTTGTQAPAILRHALEGYLEDIQDQKAANAVLQRIEQGQESTMPLDQLQARLNDLDS